MQYTLLTLRLIFILVSAYGEIGERPRFKCPRAHQLDEGCIFKGKFINEAKCLELCRNFFQNEIVLGGVEAVCENSEECECVTLPAEDDDRGFGFIRDLVELVESRSATSHETVKQPTEIKCGYYDTLITAQECRILCTKLQRSRGKAANPAYACRENSRCKCEASEGDILYVNLDTLEARYRHEDTRDAASDLWLWFEAHDQFMDSRIEFNNRNHLMLME